MRNTVFLAIVGTLLAIALSAVPAYVLSRFRLPGGELFFVILLTGMVLPQQAIIVPLYDVMQRLEVTEFTMGAGNRAWRVWNEFYSSVFEGFHGQHS